MLSYYFYPAQSETDYQVVQNAVAGYREVHDPHGVIETRTLVEPPAVLDLEGFISTLPGTKHESTRRYLEARINEFLPSIAETVPAFPSVPQGAVKFGLLAAPLDEYPRGTVVAVRAGEAVDVFIVLAGWSVGEDGRLNEATDLVSPLALPPTSPAAVFRPSLANELMNSGRLDFGANTVRKGSDVVLTIINYGGQLLAMTLKDMPGFGLLISCLASLAQSAMDEALSDSPHLLEDIKNMLLQSKISLETDLAMALIRSFQSYRSMHYDTNWLNEIMNSKDPNAPDVIAKRTKIQEFANKILDQLSNPKKLSDSIALTQDDESATSKNLHQAPDAMLKCGGYFLLANIFLGLGLEAYGAIYTMEGKKAARPFAEALMGRSKDYLGYAQRLQSTATKQVEERKKQLHIIEGAGGIGLYDDYQVPEDKPWKLACVQTWYIHCDRDKQMKAANEALPTVQENYGKAYRAELCSWFWDGPADGFDKAVDAMKKQDDLIKLNYANCKA